MRVLFDLPYKLRLQCTMPEQVSTLSNAIKLSAVVVPPPLSLTIGCSKLLSVEGSINSCTVTLVQQAQVLLARISCQVMILVLPATAPV